MMAPAPKHDFRGRTVLITGGTRGIGRATSLAFARLGAHCVLTHKWGSAEASEVNDAFLAASGREPLIVEADAGNEEDTISLVDRLKGSFSSIDVFVSNVALAQLTPSMDEYARRDLLRSIEYSAWPLAAYTTRLRAAFGRPPRYVIGLSSAGPDTYIPNYDLVACSKAVLETLCRYMAHHLAGEDCRVNIVRAGMVRTDSLVATLGAARVAELESRSPKSFLEAEEVADAIVGLCSGWFDAMSGQVINVDRGFSFSSPGLG
jgi:NAD(P)-dependent dehydrogenase (short-subunit alcohol dehydrogenase family)